MQLPNSTSSLDKASQDSSLNGAAPVKRIDLLTPAEYAEKIRNVAYPIALALQSTKKVDKAFIRDLMDKEFGGTNAERAWGRKDAYEAQEFASVMLLHSAARMLRPKSPQQVLEFLKQKQDQLPTQTVRSGEQDRFQQFSTPLPLSFIALRAAKVIPGDIVLEPSAGTGIMASMAKLNRAQVVVNELSENRAAILEKIFLRGLVFRENAEQLHNILPPGVIPSVVLANPPFSRSPGRKKNNPKAILLHTQAALSRLAEGGRMVLISGENFKGTSPTWRNDFIRLQEQATIVGSFGVKGTAYAKHGTSFATRITVFDKTPNSNPEDFSRVDNSEYGSADLLGLVSSLPGRQQAQNAKLLIGLPVAVQTHSSSHSEGIKTQQSPQSNPQTPIHSRLEQRPKHTSSPPPQSKPPQSKPPQSKLQASTQTPLTESTELSEAATGQKKGSKKKPAPDEKAIVAADKVPLQQGAAPAPAPLPERNLIPKRVRYSTQQMPANDSGSVEDALDCFESYAPKRITIDGAKRHPTDLVESAGMSPVLPPIPSYQPILPEFVVSQGVLSDSQLESVIYAGNSHSQFIKGFYKPDKFGDELIPTSADDRDGRQYRRGFFLGDGTGCGKGRQVAAVIMDNFLQGRTKAVWVSKTDSLFEDAVRDWQAVGGNAQDLHRQKGWKLEAPIELKQGIVFLTYAMLRSERNGHSRLDQLNKWLGDDFQGAIIFDESHEMGGAVAVKNDIGISKSASQQGVKGLRLQNLNPGARVEYVSATGATEVSNLSYACRLGLWGSGEFPFDNIADFTTKIQDGGIAAMEVVARDLKALGLYLSRVLSFKGVENEMLEVKLTEEQRHIYNTYAKGFQVIHQNMQQALIAAGIVEDDGHTLNGQAKGAAISSFESMKQRFFNHLLTAVKVPELIENIEHDLAGEHSVVVQIVSTNEAHIDRKIQTISESERSNLNIDITPRDAIVEFLVKSFPTKVYEERETEGRVFSELATDSNGDPIESAEAVAIRDKLVRDIALLPPLSGALEQLLKHFGGGNVAEVTGRSNRILYEKEDDRFYIAKRVAGSNVAETKAFMTGEKRILVFSDAGGTGRSYHSDLNYPNQQKRIHYVLEAGWIASKAVQGLGRTHRTNQRHAPLFRVMTTDVLGEKRFISSICKRVNQLGALTRGQREAAGQSIFDDESNLESRYASRALSFLYDMVVDDKIEGFSVAQFQEATGLRLINDSGAQVVERPPMRRFLNRMLALPIESQNKLFNIFNDLHQGVIEAAREAGTYESGMKALPGESFELKDRSLLYTHPGTGSTTICSEIETTRSIDILTAEQALRMAQGEIENIKDSQTGLFINEQSGRPAIIVPTISITDDNGSIISRVKLIHPATETRMRRSELAATKWQPVTENAWEYAWEKEMEKTPPIVKERVFMISGLLLPVWTDLRGKDSSTVYQVRLDDGERVLGRSVPAEEIARLSQVLGLSSKINLTPDEIYRAVLEVDKNIQIGGGLSLSRSRVDEQNRIEVKAAKRFSEPLLERLKAAGCYEEIIQYRVRVFISANPFVAAATIKQLQDAFSGAGGQVPLEPANTDRVIEPI